MIHGSLKALSFTSVSWCVMPAIHCHRQNQCIEHCGKAFTLVALVELTHWNPAGGFQRSRMFQDVPGFRSGFWAWQSNNPPLPNPEILNKHCCWEQKWTNRKNKHNKTHMLSIYWALAEHWLSIGHRLPLDLRHLPASPSADSLPVGWGSKSRPEATPGSIQLNVLRTFWKLKA